MKGIDISNNNNIQNFQSIKDLGYEIVYLKATEGLTFNDGCMRDFYNRAKAVGLKVGFYHFMHNNNAIDEAKHFLNVVNGLESDCLYALDVEAEELSKSPWETSQKIIDFCEYLRNQNKEPCVYTYKYFWNDVIKGNARNYPLWVANYSASASIDNYVGWQYSEKGSLAGTTGDIDMDIFNESILLKKQVPVQAPQLVIQQENNFCKSINENSQPLFDVFVTNKENVLCKELPDNNSKTNGDLVTINRPLHIYAKQDIWALVNPKIHQYVALEWLNATNPCKIIKKVRVINADGAYCKENPSVLDKTNGIVPYGKELNAWRENGEWLLVNPNNLSWQWIRQSDAKEIK